MANQEHLDKLLKWWKTDWNDWRKGHPEIKPDLEGANLSGLHLSDTNLSGANLSGANLSGVNLSRANLLGANLSNANLPRVNLSNANLSGMNLSGAKLFGAELSGINLSKANLSGASLSGATLLEANLSGATLLGAKLLAGDLSGANLLGANLSGANLLGAYLPLTNLVDANLVGTNLVCANLVCANLSGANLSEAYLSGIILDQANLKNTKLIKAHLFGAKLVNADLTGANITEACIKDWHINENTKLDNVVCDCIFLGYDDETKQPKDRRPASGSFAPGEFAVLLQRIQETIDLVFLNGIDWKAFAASFFNVQSESGGGELSIQAIEKKKDGAFVIRVTIPEGADKADIEKQLKQEYEWELKLIEQKYKCDLQAKEEQILNHQKENTKLWNIVETMASRPISINIDNKAESHQMSGNQEFNFPNTQIAGGAFGSHGGTHTGGTINNYGQQQDLAAAAAEIQTILNQLSEQYPTTTIVEQAIVAQEAVQQVEANPQLKSRVIGAIKGAGAETFKQAVNHPAVSIFLEAVKGWSEAK